MSNLDVLTLVLLAMVKSLRETVDPADFDTLAEDVDRVKREPVNVLRDLFNDQFSIEWDGVQKLGEVVVAERKRQAAIATAIREIDRKIVLLGNAKLRLVYPAIAGCEQVSAAVEAVKTVVAEAMDTTDASVTERVP